MPLCPLVLWQSQKVCSGNHNRIHRKRREDRTRCQWSLGSNLPTRDRSPKWCLIHRQSKRTLGNDGRGNPRIARQKLIQTIISKLKDQKNENILLKENIKNLNLKISELKLLHTKLNTELINKDKEISDMKKSI